ncbi:MAG: hypothetical protein JSV20_03180 [Candidatus Bathyarchaeota archaeon]|nr:MAG: hypothetical protein JSV20_03180 [Candidatus Bathyarchaeota archaeon]
MVNISNIEKLKASIDIIKISYDPISEQAKIVFALEIKYDQAHAIRSLEKIIHINKDSTDESEKILDDYRATIIQTMEKITFPIKQLLQLSSQIEINLYAIADKLLKEIEAC